MSKEVRPKVREAVLMTNEVSVNPFEVKTRAVEDCFLTWAQMYPKAYNKQTTSPFTKVRIILMNGTEFESNWFLHNFARNCNDAALKRQLAIVRAQEQQQQKRIAALKPIDEHFLETTIGYEQLAIELTAILAQRDKDLNNKKALDFALLEDFDHLYRFANLLKTDFNIDADMLVGRFTEIMPGRPTISEHRHPYDNVRCNFVAVKADPFTKLAANIITAAEQQTMNFYMNMGSSYKTDLGRKLFAEIALIEEQHVTQYESLSDPTCTWLEKWVSHEYTEAYLYYSMMQDETDAEIKKIWEEHFYMEAAHLKLATELLKKYEKTPVSKVLPVLEFPQALKFGGNKEYIRKVILETVGQTAVFENYTEVSSLPKDANFFKYQKFLNGNLSDVASHMVIKETIAARGQDYRYQDGLHPVKELDNRKVDNTEVGRK